MWQVEGTGSVQYNLVSVSPWWSSTLSSISDFLLNKGLNKKKNYFMLLCLQFVSVFISFIIFIFFLFEVQNDLPDAGSQGGLH